MAKVTVDVPAKDIEASLVKENKSLRGKNRRLQDKNEALTYIISENKEVVKRANAIIEAVKGAGDLMEMYDG